LHSWDSQLRENQRELAALSAEAARLQQLDVRAAALCDDVENRYSLIR
jgi:hypothetical protein